jgi:hypothetical protein
MIRVSIFAVVLAVSSVAHAASECKGLDEATCASKPLCQWVPERIKGETKTFAGVPHKRSAKAHCRLETVASRAKEIKAPATTEQPAETPTPAPQQ